MARKSIEPRVPRAVPLRSLSSESRQELAKRFGLPNEKQLEERLRDRAFVRERVAALPTLCLLILEIVVEQGGVTTGDYLSRLVRARVGAQLSYRSLQDAEHELFSSGLAVGALAHDGSLSQVAVLAPAGDALYELLAGVSLPGSPPPDDVPVDASARRRVRDMIALCGLTAQRRIRFAQSGNVDRTTLKRFTKDLGVTVEDAESTLATAKQCGWLTEQHGRVIPNVTALLHVDRQISLARGVPAWSALIPEQGWVSAEEVARRADPSESDWGVGAVHRKHSLALVAAQPCLQVTEHADEFWIRRISAEPATGDGHVTPSFEVLLGPAAAVGIVLRVSLCCELLRVDHVLTLKLTPDSVARGLACGLEPDDLRGALKAISPHGLPDNVAFMLEDWIAAAKFVRVQQGLFVFAEPDVADRLVLELRENVVSRPQPGVIEIADTLSEGELDKALAKARVVVRSATHASASTPGRQQVVRAHEKVRAAFEPDAELHSRVLQARQRGDYGVDLAAAPAVESTVGGSARTGPMAELLRFAMQLGAPSEALELLEMCAEWREQLAPALSKWAQRLRASARQEAEFVVDVPLTILPWLVLNAEWRNRVLLRATDVDTLISQANSSMRHKERLRERGLRAVDLMSRGDVTESISMALIKLLSGQGHGPHLDVDEDFDDDDDDELDELTPSTHPAEQLRRPALERQPLPGTMSALEQTALHALLVSAVASARVVHIQSGHHHVLTVIAEAVRKRGQHDVLHCTEFVHMEARVIKLKDIRAAQLDEAAIPALAGES
jgi:hypothetical protein